MQQIKLTPAQEQIVTSDARYRVVCCGRRFGKTTLAVWEMVAMASLTDEAKVAYIAPTYQQARDIAWETLKNVTRTITKSVNESRLEIVLKNGSTIVLRGWESIETLRGQAFDFVVVDEIASMRSWEYNWKEVLRPTLTDRKGQALFISTPKGFNHFYDLFNMQDDPRKGKAYASFHFTSYDNPFMPKEEIDDAKDELGEDAFAQEYLADFRTVTGAVCKWFSREKHLERLDCDVWFEAVDAGFKDPFAYLLIGKSGEKLYVADGFREAELDSEKAVEMRNAIKGERVVSDGIADSNDPRMLDELSEQGWVLQPVKKVKGENAKSWDQMLSWHMHKWRNNVFINPDLTWLIQEIETLMWKEKTNKEEYLPMWDDHRRYGHHYDGIRALAYFLIMQGDPGFVGYEEAPVEKSYLDPVAYEPFDPEDHKHNPWVKPL